MFYEKLTVVSRKIVVGFGYVYEGSNSENKGGV